MAHNSDIEWTESTWNPITGCTKISSGCKNCYAERMALRLQRMGQANYRNGFEVTTHEHVLDYPLRWKKPRIIFVNSMSDLFHEDVPVGFIECVFDVMERANWHIFQVLTKRAERLTELSNKFSWPENVWVGVTVEENQYLSRVSALRETPASVKFLSLEPLLSELPGLQLEGLDWVIVGGESGPRARQMKKQWVLDIRDKCLNANVPFFFKQWGGVFKKRKGRILENRTWDQTPLQKQFSFAY